MLLNGTRMIFVGRYKPHLAPEFERHLPDGCSYDGRIHDHVYFIEEPDLCGVPTPMPVWIFLSRLR